jgi:hypothetical protein
MKINLSVTSTRIGAGAMDFTRDSWTVDEWLHADLEFGLARKRLTTGVPAS